jgi:hypothetical protein
MSFKTIISLLIINILSITFALAQEKKTTDSSSLFFALKKGEFHGFSRSYFMSTINQGSLKDFYNFGSSIGGHYETAKWKGFQLGATASFIFNLAGTDLAENDTTTNKPSRYELGIYDVTNPNRRWDLGKLEEIYLQYHLQKSSITLGRQLLNTPFINPQDGRIRPSFAEGAWLDIQHLKYFQFQAGYLWRMSPRSTVDWYNVGQSIGLYPVGRNPDGSPAGYAGQTKSSGILLANVDFHRKNEALGCEMHIQLWDQVVTNVFNTTLLQADWSKKLNEQGLLLHLGVQGINQLPVGNGGNDNDSLRYFALDNKTWILGGQAAISMPKEWRIELNYTRIFDGGRFIMPREWGREPLYTFIPRERTEGSANMHAFTTNLFYSFQKAGLKTKISYGHYLLTDVKDAKTNKYAMPSYGHLELMLDKNFKGKWSILHFKLLYMYKMAYGETYNNANFIYNKVNMHHLDLMMNVNF